MSRPLPPAAELKKRPNLSIKEAMVVSGRSRKIIKSLMADGWLLWFMEGKRPRIVTESLLTYSQRRAGQDGQSQAERAVQEERNRPWQLRDREVDAETARLHVEEFLSFREIARSRGVGLTAVKDAILRHLCLEARKQFNKAYANTYNDLQVQALVAALSDLHTLVWGECPSLLNEDSGGDAQLDLRIRELLARHKQQATA